MLIGDASVVDSAMPTRVPRLDLLPATVDLSGAEIELVGARRSRPPARRRRSTRSPAGRWDICLIDCPPSLGLLTVNALVAARHLLVPLQCEFFALEGLEPIAPDGRADSRRLQSASLSILGVALTMFDRRNNLSQQVAEDVRACLGPAVFETVVPRNVRLSEAPSHGLPALIYDLRCAGSEAYIRLARELIGAAAAARGGGMSRKPARGSGAGCRRCSTRRCAPGGRRPRRSARAAAFARSRSRGSGPTRTSRGVHFDEAFARRAGACRSPSAACFSRSCCAPTATGSRSSPASGAGGRRSARGCTAFPRSSAISTTRRRAEIALIENIQREDLNAIEEADGYRQLIERHGHSQEDVAAIVHKSRSHVANLLRLLDLARVRARCATARRYQHGARAGRRRRARPRSAGARNHRQGTVGAPGRGAGRAAQAPAERARRQAATPVDADLAALERQLGDMLGLKVQVAHNGTGGTVTLHYISLDQLDMVCQRLYAASRSSQSGAIGVDRSSRFRRPAGGRGRSRSVPRPSASRCRQLAGSISCALEPAGALGDRAPGRSRIPLATAVAWISDLSFQNKDLPSDAMTASGRSPRSTRARIGASMSTRRCSARIDRDRFGARRRQPRQLLGQRVKFAAPAPGRQACSDIALGHVGADRVDRVVVEFARGMRATRRR